MKAPTTDAAAAISGGDLFLERAEYVSPDYARRLVLEFDWQRAAAGSKPWGVRLYVGRPHEVHGVAWRLARRKTWAASQRMALARFRAWMLGA